MQGRAYGTCLRFSLIGVVLGLQRSSMLNVFRDLELVVYTGTRLYLYIYIHTYIIYVVLYVYMYIYI